MGLYDAMNASVTGMAAQSNYLANIGQNIANSGTVGYKQASTQFSTLVDQAGVGQTSAGGVATVTTNLISTQGTLESTTSSTDLAVSGNGYLVVSNAAGQQFLTRAGSFVTNANGDLVNSAGYYLNGYSLANGTPTMASNSLSGMQVVNVNSASLSATPSTTGTLTANLPSTDTIVATANLPSANASTAAYSEKTSMVVYDNLGASHTIDLYMSKTATNTWEVSAYDNADKSTTTTSGFPYSSSALSTATLSFSASNGELTSTSASRPSSGCPLRRCKSSRMMSSGPWGLGPRNFHPGQSWKAGRLWPTRILSAVTVLPFARNSIAPFFEIGLVALAPFRSAEGAAAGVDDSQRSRAHRHVFFLKLAADIHVVEMEFELFVEFDAVLGQRFFLHRQQHAIHQFERLHDVAING